MSSHRVEQPVDGEVVVLADGDQRRGGDERGDLAGDQLAGLDVQVHGVGGEEVVAGVAVELRALAAAGGVLDGERVQPELVGHELQICPRRARTDPPRRSPSSCEVLGDAREGEALVDQDSVPVAPGVCRPGGPESPDGGGHWSCPSETCRERVAPPRCTDRAEGHRRTGMFEPAGEPLETLSAEGPRKQRDGPDPR